MKTAKEIKLAIYKQCTHANTHILNEQGINDSEESCNFITTQDEYGHRLHVCFDCCDKADAAVKTNGKTNAAQRKAEIQAIAPEVMRQAGVTLGMKVKKYVGGNFVIPGAGSWVTGTVIQKSGIPYVKIDGKGQKTTRWDNGWTPAN